MTSGQVLNLSGTGWKKWKRGTRYVSRSDLSVSLVVCMWIILEIWLWALLCSLIHRFLRPITLKIWGNVLIQIYFCGMFTTTTTTTTTTRVTLPPQTVLQFLVKTFDRDLYWIVGKTGLSHLALRVGFPVPQSHFLHINGTLGRLPI